MGNVISNSKVIEQLKNSSDPYEQSLGRIMESTGDSLFEWYSKETKDHPEQHTTVYLNSIIRMMTSLLAFVINSTKNKETGLGLSDTMKQELMQAMIEKFKKDLKETDKIYSSLEGFVGSKIPKSMLN